MHALTTSRTIEVPVPTTEGLARWRQTIDFAKRHGLVPLGYRLEKQMLGDHDLRIKLIAGNHANAKKPPGQLVPVSSRIGVTHPAVVAMKDGEDQLQIPRLLPMTACEPIDCLSRSGHGLTTVLTNGLTESAGSSRTDSARS